MRRNYVVRLPPLKAQGRGTDLPEAVGSPLQAMLVCALFLAVMCLRLAIQQRQTGGLRLEDDAYYYTVVAQRIATTGISTFDGQTLLTGTTHSGCCFWWRRMCFSGVVPPSLSRSRYC